MNKKDSKKLTESFIKDAQEIYGDKYDYSKVVRNTYKDKVCVVCPTHGEFYTTYMSHIKNQQECPECKKENAFKLFCESATKIHNGFYDYSKVNYVNNKTKVCIICPIHGEFWQKPFLHLKGSGCQKCKSKSYLERLPNETDQELFIRKANIVHSNKYDYSKVEYINSYTKVCIICPEHGEFWQLPNDHISNHSECPKCARNSMIQKTAFSNEEAIDKLKSIYGDKYDYSKVIYENNRSWITLICPVHGEFKTKAEWAFKGNGCKKCAIDARKLTTEIFVERAVAIHGNKYDYSLVDYKDYKTPVKIICPEHGEFLQSPNSHLGINPCGCPKCSSLISRGEKELYNKLVSKNIIFTWQHLIQLSNKNLYVDFYLEKDGKKYIIEYNGAQHYKQVKRFHSKDSDFLQQIDRDFLLKEYCLSNKITLIEIPDMADDMYINYILEKIWK